MMITLDLSPEVEKQLKEAADQKGADVAVVANELLQIALLQWSQEPATQQAQLPTPINEWERDIIEFPKSLRPLSHHLSNEDLSRENIYED
jgi:hypothetical protein